MYYDEVEPCINSVMATEHAVTCANIGYYENKIKDCLLDDIIEEYFK